jgi:Fur family iron response transcriptional regulator
LIREVIVDPNRIFYDSNTAAHHHLYDVDQGTLMDIDATAVQISSLPPMPEGVTRVGIDVIVRVRSGTKSG